MRATTFTRAIGLATGLLTVAATTASAEFAKGADVSWLPRSEARGVKYYDANGVAGDCLAIIKGLGINSIRLRTWINPSMTDDFSGHCSQAETIAMAMRCKKLGLRVMIDFHYYNTWTSVGKPNTPKEWVGMTYPQMQTALYNYAYGFCKAIRDSGVTPEWFQNGNETNGGLCPPTGSVSSNPVQMTGLLNKGYEAIHAIFPLPYTKVMLHVAQPQNTAGAAMVTAFLKNGGKMDALGWSSYASSGNVDLLAGNVRAWHDKNFKMETFMVEIGNSGTANNQILIQKWNDSISMLNKPCEGGTFYWEPEAYGAPGNWSDAIFDKTGKPMSCWAAYKSPVKNPCTVDLKPSAAPMVVEKATLSRTINGGLLIHKAGQFQFKAYDLTGRTVGSGSVMDVAEMGSELKAGVYMVKLESSEGHQVLQAVKY